MVPLVIFTFDKWSSCLDFKSKSNYGSDLEQAAKLLSTDSSSVKMGKTPPTKAELLYEEPRESQEYKVSGIMPDTAEGSVHHSSH